MGRKSFYAGELFIPMSCVGYRITPKTMISVGDVHLDCRVVHVYVIGVETTEELLSVFEQSKRMYERSGEWDKANKMKDFIFYFSEPLFHKPMPEGLLELVPKSFPYASFRELKKEDVVYFSS